MVRRMSAAVAVVQRKKSRSPVMSFCRDVFFGRAGVGATNWSSCAFGRARSMIRLMSSGVQSRHFMTCQCWRRSMMRLATWRCAALMRSRLIGVEEGSMCVLSDVGSAVAAAIRSMSSRSASAAAIHASMLDLGVSGRLSDSFEPIALSAAVYVLSESVAMNVVSWEPNCCRCRVRMCWRCSPQVARSLSESVFRVLSCCPAPMTLNRNVSSVFWRYGSSGNFAAAIFARSLLVMLFVSVSLADPTSLNAFLSMERFSVPKCGLRIALSAFLNSLTVDGLTLQRIR